MVLLGLRNIVPETISPDIIMNQLSPNRICHNVKSNIINIQDIIKARLLSFFIILSFTPPTQTSTAYTATHAPRHIAVEV